MGQVGSLSLLLVIVELTHGTGREFAVAFQRVIAGGTGGYTELFITTTVASASVSVSS